MEEGEGEWDLCETRDHAPDLVGIMPYVDVGIMPLFWSGSSPLFGRESIYLIIISLLGWFYLVFMISFMFGFVLLPK